MPTIIFEKQKVELSFEQVLAAVKQLTPDEIARLQSELLDDAWRLRLDKVLKSMRQSVAASPITDAEIDAEVEAVRTARYAQSRH